MTCDDCKLPNSRCIQAFPRNFHQDFDPTIREQIVYKINERLDLIHTNYQEIAVISHFDWLMDWTGVHNRFFRENSGD